jgi:hypothetical protein
MKWNVQVSQNCWEYSGWVEISADKLVKVDDLTVIADGVVIKFDEEIGRIEQLPNQH